MRGDCDVAEYCNGAGACPANAFEPTGTACGSGADTNCDNPDTCNSSGVCQSNFEPTSAVCRPASGSGCDAVEYCDGGGGCPVDAFLPSGTTCGDQTDTICDNPNTCNASGVCQPNYEPGSTLCNPDAGDCDVAEYCNGVGSCPANAFESAGTLCGDPSNTDCDNPDTCNGSGVCQDNWEPNTIVCRPADISGCDVAEQCSDGVCPENSYSAAGTACGSSASTACNQPDTCDGDGTCEVNWVADGTVCNAAVGPCDVAEVCASGVCPGDAVQPAGTACGSSSSTICDLPDSCNGSSKNCQSNYVTAVSNTVCNAAQGDCFNSVVCDGSGNCPTAAPKSSGVTCGSSVEHTCDHQDTCDGAGVCLPNFETTGTTCATVTNPCEAPGVCDGSGGCGGGGWLPSGTACNDASNTECDNPDNCDGAGTCLVNNELSGFACGDSTSTTCNAADTCDGSGACSSNFATAGTSCGSSSNTDCDNPDACDGSGVCATNWEPTSVVCRPADGTGCDLTDYCNGSGACAADAKQPSGTACGSQLDTNCDNPNTCNSSGACQNNYELSTFVCRPADPTGCDVTEYCNGSGSCPADTKAAEFTACGDSTVTTCNLADSCNATGTCLPRYASSATICRPGNECDLSEYCDGTGTCPTDFFVSAGTACGSSSNTDCDNPDTCDGSGTCSPNYEPSSLVCRPADGSGCDLADNCNGAGACNPDAKKPEFSACGSSSDTVCDNPDTCNASGVCLARWEADGTVCNAASGACDVAEACASGVCPADGVRPSGYACGSSANSICDHPDSCNGVSKACQTNYEPLANNTVCNAAQGDCFNSVICDGAGNCPSASAKAMWTACGSSVEHTCDHPDYCDGTGVCLPNYEPGGTACTTVTNPCESPGVCSGSGQCGGGGFQPAGTACGSSTVTECTAADSCDGAGFCLDNHMASGTFCGSSTNTECNLRDTCNGTGACQPNLQPYGTTCGSSSSTTCDSPDFCDGTGICLTNWVPSSEVCRAAASDCDVAENCDGAGACPANSYKSSGTACGSSSNTECDNPDTCNATGTCLVNNEPNGTNCGDAGGPCINQDTCSGGACIDNGFKPNTTVCNDNLFCTLTDRCSGVSSACVGTGSTCLNGSTCLEATDECVCGAGYFGDLCELCIVYVDDSATGTPDGLSWSTAYNSVQDGILSAVSRGCEVWVAEGVYETDTYPDASLMLAAGVEVYGGFTAGDQYFEDRDPQSARTILDGFDNSRVVVCDYNATSVASGTVLGCDSGTVLDGFEIVRGRTPASNSGAGLYVDAYTAGTRPEFIDLVFADNYSSYYGGAVYVATGRPWFEGCTFMGNQGTYGGAIYAYSNTAVDIVDCMFLGNRAYTFSGGAIRASTAVTLNIENSFFAGNASNGSTTSYGGGALAMATGTTTMINSTIAYNRSSSVGGAIYKTTGTLNIHNSILWGDTAITSNPEIYNSGGTGCTYTYSDLADTTGCTAGSGNISADPQFILDDPNPTYQGVWDNVYFDDDTLMTVLVDRDMPRYPGSLAHLGIVPDTASPYAFLIADNDGAEIYVLGDITDKVSTGDSYRLMHLGITAASPAVDTANDAVAPSTDFGGSTRVDLPGLGNAGTVTDMGAAEAETPCVVYLDYGRAVDTGGGLTWATAKKQAQSAIDLAATMAATAPRGYCEVWMRKTTVTSAPAAGVTMKNNVHLHGGFNGTESHLLQADWYSGKSELSGGGTTPTVMNCVSPTCGDNVVLEGVNFSNGNGGVSGVGAGLYVYGYLPAIRHCGFSGNVSTANAAGMYWNIPANGTAELFNCEFTSNQVDGTSSYAWGGATYFAGGTASTIRIAHSRFTGNQAFNANISGRYARGGAIGANSSGLALEIDDSVFENNSASGYSSHGGVIYKSYANTTITNSYFYGNYSGSVDTGSSCSIIPNSISYGAVAYFTGLSSSRSQVNISNSVFHDNRAGSYGTVQSSGYVDMNIYHSTFNSNCARSSSADVRSYTNDVTLIYNSVFFNGYPTTEGGVATRLATFGTMEVYYSMVQGGWTGVGSNNLDISSSGCTSNSAIFRDRGALPYPDLMPAYSGGVYSCLVDAAYPFSDAPALDIVGTTRQDSAAPNESTGTIYDMGAYEFSMEYDCDDAIDNNSNGLTDCADPDCSGQLGPSSGLCQAEETLCSDSYDNDGDGLTDCPVITAMYPRDGAAVAGDDVDITFATRSSVRYYCRTAHVSAIASAPWVYCDGGTGTNPWHRPTIAVNGVTRTEARLYYTTSGLYSEVIETPYDYYVHTSMNSADKCAYLDVGGSEIPDSAYFAEAASIGLPNTGTFPTDGSVKIRSPFISIPFNPPASSSQNLYVDPVYGRNLEGLSLRRRFTLSPDRTKLLIIRTYESRTYDGKCVTLDYQVHNSSWRMLAGWTFPWNEYHYSKQYCDAVVLNTEGAGVCLTTSSGVPELAQTRNAPFQTYSSDLDDISYFMWRAFTGHDKKFSKKCWGDPNCNSLEPQRLYLPDDTLF